MTAASFPGDTRRRLRVLYLNPFSQQVSGPDESLLTLLQPLIPMGVEAHLVLPASGPHVPRYESLGVKVHFAPLTILKRRPGPGAALLPFRLLRGSAAVSRIVRRERIDLIHTNMEVVLDGAVAARLSHIPHVLHYRGNTLDHPRLAFDVLARFWASTAKKVFCISEATAEIFRKRGLGAKIEVLYNPVEMTGFATAERSDDCRRELGAGPGDLLVGTVGRIHPRKDIATFLRAGALVAKDFPNLRLAVVGAAEVPEEIAYHAELKTLADNLGVASRLCWAGAKRAMPRILKSLDVFVLCSRNEGFGRVVAEAMAAGTPVVATREGALPELLDHGLLGVLADPCDAPAFATGIAQLLSNSDRARDLAVAARTRAAAFEATPIARRVLAVYQGLGAGGRSASDSVNFPSSQSTWTRLSHRGSFRSGLRVALDSLRGREGSRVSAAELRTFYASEYIRRNPELDAEDAGRKADALADACRRAGLERAPNVLEVGCGSGAVLARLGAALHAERRIGVDFGEPQACVAAASGAHIAVADGATLPFADRCFDFAYFVDVLEHVLDPTALLVETARVARRVGFLVPLEAGLVASPAYAFRRIRGKPTNLEQYGHVWRWFRTEVLGLMRKAGLQVVCTLSHMGPQGHFTSPVGRVFDRARRLTQSVSPSLSEVLFGGVALVGIAVPRDPAR